MADGCSGIYNGNDSGLRQGKGSRETDREYGDRTGNGNPGNRTGAGK